LEEEGRPLALEKAEVGNQTLLHCLFPLLYSQSSSPWACLWRPDTLGGWPLARQAVGPGLSRVLSPSLGRPYHPCCGSQSPSADPEAVSPFSIPREKTQGATVSFLLAGCSKDHAFTSSSLRTGR